MRPEVLALLIPAVLTFAPIVLAVIYVLFCMNRASTSLIRLADAVEELVRRQDEVKL